MMEQFVIDDSSYSPTINTKSARLVKANRDYRPIHQRLDTISKDKAHMMAKYRAQKMSESASETNFSPRISKRSRQIASAMAKSAPSTPDRAPVLLTASARPSTPRAVPSPAPCRFTPVINRKSERLVTESRMFSEKSFVERQDAFEARRIKKRQDLIARQSPSGRPMTAKRNDVKRTAERLYDNKPTRPGRTPAPAPEFSFRPDINPNSRAMARKSTVQQLVDDERTKMKRELARKVAEAKFAEEHTFRPEMVAKSTGKSHYDFENPDNIISQIGQDNVERAIRQEALKRTVDVEEVVGCTFTPSIIKKVPVQATPVDVKGLGRFFEKKDLSRRAKAEQTELEDKAFIAQVDVAAAPSPTVPRPFAFTLPERPGRAERRAKEEEAARNAAMAECTFQPDTGQAEQSRIIQAILDDGGSDSEVDENTEELLPPRTVMGLLG